ncbi:MAG: DUF2520 domain-containing protein [Sorangiineae bacterium]|nr:DUF2520 domain-containing protein [Polyangiaceae bacterium]MEB2320920.1 DUF2520 domain-containing protein [Sorangiineae bacterium]
MNIAIIGAGKVGGALARALRAAGAQVTLRAARRRLPARPIAAELLVLAVRDHAITPLAHELARAGSVRSATAVVHLSGALGPEALAPLAERAAGVGQAHPMLSFAAPGAAPALPGAHWLLTGDPAAVRAARRMARLLRMRAHEWPGVDRALYHAAGGLVANGVAALAAAGAELLERAGVPPHEAPRLLGPLIESVGANVLRLGLPEALSGPVRRGDAAAIRAHLARIGARAPGVLPLYLALARAQLPLARALGDAASDELDAVARVLALPGGRGERAARSAGRGARAGPADPRRAGRPQRPR